LLIESNVRLVVLSKLAQVQLVPFAIFKVVKLAVVKNLDRIPIFL
jgi:hypothetical protein